jgi:hypothetical protein
MTLRRWAEALISTEAEVPISCCAHYCGFRYGRGGTAPYQRYLLDLAEGVPLKTARRRFIEFLFYYRPRHMGEALGLTELDREYPLWIYPWEVVRRQTFERHTAWLASPDDCPDIVTHFSDAGVLSFRIDEEFFWLERAMHAVRSDGYRPLQKGYIVVTEFVRQDGTSAYLVRDGNHRLSALSALGHDRARVRKRLPRVLESSVDDWYGVGQGLYTRADALAIFHTYFRGNHRVRTTDSPATIVGPNSWKELYL